MENTEETAKWTVICDFGAGSLDWGKGQENWGAYTCQDREQAVRLRDFIRCKGGSAGIAEDRALFEMPGNEIQTWQVQAEVRRGDKVGVQLHTCHNEEEAQDLLALLQAEGIPSKLKPVTLHRGGPGSPLKGPEEPPGE
jgi:hypothetical protein